MAVHVMTLGQHQAAPHKGHLKRLQRIHGCVKKHNDAAVRFRAGIPDHSEQDASHVPHMWECSVHRDVQGETSSNMSQRVNPSVKHVSGM
jgi:hypothetical protein